MFIAMGSLQTLASGQRASPFKLNRSPVVKCHAAALLSAVSVLGHAQAPAPAQNKGKDKGVTVGLYLNQQPAPTGPITKLADGTPDLSGAWLGGSGGDADIENTRALKPGDKVIM